MGYIVVNISDLTKAIDGVLFLSCNILGLYKFIGIYRKRVSAAKLIAGLQNASIAGPKKAFLDVDQKSNSYMQTFKWLLICTLIAFNLSAIASSYIAHRNESTTFYDENWGFPFKIACVHRQFYLLDIILIENCDCSSGSLSMQTIRK